MLHLLPEHQKKMIILEYRKRLVIVICLFIIGVSLIGIISLIPSYIIASSRFYKIDSQRQDVESRLNQISGDNSAEAVSRAADKIAILSPLGAKEDASTVFDMFNTTLIDGIKITHYGYLLNANNSITFDVEGEALNRDILLAFARSVEESGLFTGAEVPLSSLRNDKDIKFNFKLSLVQKVEGEIVPTQK